MKKLLISLAIFLFFAFLSPALATSSDYIIEDFKSEITINQDTSLTVAETILVNFNINKHGIFRIIPTIYTAHGRTINAQLKILSIENEMSQPYQYQTSRLNQSIKIQIGDPGKTIIGEHIYIIKYQMKNILLVYSPSESEGMPELYWNVTGSEWDTTIKQAKAIITSPYGKIAKTESFNGKLINQTENSAEFSAVSPLSWGDDFTIVVGLEPENNLIFPGILERSISFLAANWGYPLALLPLAIIFFFWYKKGRDLRFVSGNVYYQPENQKTKTVSVFAREHLPLVYHPIDNLTPAEVGTILDEKVDIQDVVAEIIELARLGFLEIKKIKKKRLIGQKTDYLFIKKQKDTKSLKSYQKYLYQEIFSKAKDGEIKLSELKNKFYSSLNLFKKKLYEYLAQENIFSGNPEKVRLKWLIIYFVLAGAVFGPIISFVSLTANPGPILLLIAGILPAILFGKNMPRRTAWGHSLFRQITGLRYYLGKGKWREEISEKHLFLEEMLPLAICLSVVTKLTSDMAKLEVPPPSYLNGFAVSTFNADFNRFSRQASANLVSSPSQSWSGRSSWSGGSGFSGGGSSGGGFGGGGGGSW
ncbi:MAG: DUF2207 domain-containing protein [Candidatus Shapirobacteria bacterium]